jgi:hypothetical protein
MPFSFSLLLQRDSRLAWAKLPQAVWDIMLNTPDHQRIVLYFHGLRMVSQACQEENALIHGGYQHCTNTK